MQRGYRVYILLKASSPFSFSQWSGSQRSLPGHLLEQNQFPPLCASVWSASGVIFKLLEQSLHRCQALYYKELIQFLENAQVLHDAGRSLFWDEQFNHKWVHPLTAATEVMHCPGTKTLCSFSEMRPAQSTSNSRGNCLLRVSLLKCEEMLWLPGCSEEEFLVWGFSQHGLLLLPLCRFVLESEGPSVPGCCSGTSNSSWPLDCNAPGFPVHHHLTEFAQTHVHWVDDAIQPSRPLLSPSPPAPSPSQHQGLSQWASSSHQEAKGLELQLQHQSFQWIFKVDFLQDGLVWFLCSPSVYWNKMLNI